ncbi:MAG: cation-transporting P-type ATPase, partial [Longicatena sp.]
MKAFYQKEVKEIFEELNTNEAGLTKEEVVLRREKYGSNELEETKAMHPFMVFLTQFKDLLVIILIVAAIISM